MKQRYWIITGIIVLLAGIVLWWLWPSSSLKEGVHELVPELRVTALNIEEISQEKIKLVISVLLSNTLPVEINTTRVDYALYVGSVKVVQSSITEPLQINSSDSMEIKLPMEILAGSLKQVMAYFDQEKTDSADYTLEMDLNLDLPVAGERSFDFELTERLPTVRIPKITLEKIGIDKLGLKETKLNVIINMENPNLFPMKMKQGSYTFTIGKDLVIKGVYEKRVSIPPRSTEPVAMQLDLETGNVARLTWNALFDKKNTPFELVFSCKVISEKEMLANSDLSLYVSGTLDELIGKE